MFPGYASRLYNELKALYEKKTLKIEPTKSDNGEKTSKNKSTKSDNGEKTSKNKSTKSDNGEKTSKNKSTKSGGGGKTSESGSAESGGGEKTSKKNKVINIIDSSRRKYSVFIGATVLAKAYNSEQGEMSGYWITKQDWEEVGPDIVLKKCPNVIA